MLLILLNCVVVHTIQFCFYFIRMYVIPLMINGTDLDEIGVRCISGHHHDKFEFHSLDNYENIS